MSKTDDLLAKADRILELLDQLVQAPPVDPHSSRHIAITLDNLLAEQRRIRRLILALTTGEQQAVNDLSAAVETLATDIGDVTAAATAAVADLRSQVSSLTAGATVSAAQIAALQATIDTAETDVVGSLTPITARITGIDSGLKTPPAQGGSELTPTP